jgi:hypothetical protein
MGGVRAAGSTNACVEVANPSMTNTIADVSEVSQCLIVARNGHQAVKMSDGRILVFGGRSDSAELASTELTVSATATSFESFVSMNKPRAEFTHVLLGDTLIVVGGSNEDYRFEVLKDYNTNQ